MIEGLNITKRFGDLTLFENYSFKIDDGEFVCFAGESGAGKTTLLNIIGLLEPIDGGTLLINGKNLRTNKEKRLFYRDEVGFLFQNFALIENKTVRQNLEIVRKGKVTEEEILDSLRQTGMEEKLDNPVYTLSGGEQQRVALARLFLKECNIILADEPTGSLDKRNAGIVMDLLFALNRQGKTVILVTHDEAIRARIGNTIELSPASRA